MRKFIIALLMAVFVPAWAHAQTTHLSDTFTEGANTEITLHIPDTGCAAACWSVVQDPSALTQRVVSASGTFILTTASTSSTSAIVIATPDSGPTTADYTVTATLADPSLTPYPNCLIIRYTDTSNYYFGCRYKNTENPDVAIYKRVAGTTTQLTTANCGNTTSYAFVLSAAGNTIAFSNTAAGGSCDLSVSDSDLTSIGKGGLGGGNITTGGTDGVSTSPFDNFTITSTPAATGPKRLLLMGVGE